MCEVTCQCMSLHAWKILRFRSLSFLLLVSVVVLWLSSLLDASTLWLKWFKLESTLIPSSSSCLMRTVSVASDLFDFSVHFIFFLIISLITSLFLLPDTFITPNVVDKYPAYFRWGLCTLAKNNSSTLVAERTSRWTQLCIGCVLVSLNWCCEVGVVVVIKTATEICPVFQLQYLLSSKNQTVKRIQLWKNFIVVTCSCLAQVWW